VSGIFARDAAEDLTAEVFYQALANLAQFEWRGAPFIAWLLRIASNAIATAGNSSRPEKAFPTAIAARPELRMEASAA